MSHELCSEIPSEILCIIARFALLADLRSLRLLNYYYSQAISLRMMMPRCAFMHCAQSREISKNARFYRWINSETKRTHLKLYLNFARIHAGELKIEYRMINKKVCNWPAGAGRIVRTWFGPAIDRYLIAIDAWPMIHNKAVKDCALIFPAIFLRGKGNIYFNLVKLAKYLAFSWN